MKLKGIDFPIKKIFCLMLYYGVARYWPNNRIFFGGGKMIRYQLVKHIFKNVGQM